MNHSHRATSIAFVFAAASLVAIPAVLPATATCPEGMVSVHGSYCIDRFEAALVEVGTGGVEQPWSPYHTPEGAHVRAVSQAHVVPQAYINAVQADHACRASGKRLCSNSEWFRACQGPSRTNFPYGNVREAGRCNENHARHPVVQLYGQTHQYIWDGLHMNDPQLNQLPGTLALTGAFEGCTNDYGVFDMVGNLHEWTSDSNGTFRGGYYMDTHMNGDGCWYSTQAHDTSYHDYSTGFRCCADPGAATP